MNSAIETVLVILLIASVYALLYYRLLCKYFYEKTLGIKESAFGAIFSLPPYKQLPPEARKYHKRYWFALIVMLFIILIFAQTRDYTSIAHQFNYNSKM